VLATTHLTKTAPSFFELIALLGKLLNWQLLHIADVLATTIFSFAALPSRVVVTFLI